MEHYENIEYDINFLIWDEELFELFYKFKSMSSYGMLQQYNLLQYSREEFDRFINSELRIVEESISFPLKRDDIGKFQIILRKFNDDYINVRFALDLEFDLLNDNLITAIVDSFIYEFCSKISPVCITAGEVTMPYFIDEIAQWSLEGDFLYLDQSFIDLQKLSELPIYSWIFHGRGIIFFFYKWRELAIHNVLKNNSYEKITIN